MEQKITPAIVNLLVEREIAAQKEYGVKIGE